jgi:DNA-3-methyladenine glycosylase II
MDIVNQRDIDRLLKKDVHFKMIQDTYGSPPNWSREEGFISLSKIILEQQVSLASAKAHFERLSSYIDDFLPQHILSLSDDEMRACQVSRQKATYLRALSEAIINKTLDMNGLRNQDEAMVRTQLTGIKGIGHWTTDIYLMFCLQAKDIFPIGDIAVVNTIKELYDIHTRDEMLALSEKWKPLRSLASYFFWHYYLKKRIEKCLYVPDITPGHNVRDHIRSLWLHVRHAVL